MGYPVVYEPAIGVSPGPTPGARALLEWALTQDTDAYSLGIYNPRQVRGGRSWSLHAEGRAIDIGFPVVRPDGHPGGTALAQRLVDHHAELGVQQVIWAGRIWRNTRDASGWRRYSGTSSHHDHIHAELTRAASKTLTFDHIVEATEQETDMAANTTIDLGDWIDASYLSAVGRTPDPSGRAFWFTAITLDLHQLDSRDVHASPMAQTMAKGLYNEAAGKDPRDGLQ